MDVVKTFLTVILVVVLVFVLLRPGAQTKGIISALGEAQFDFIRTLTGQYPGSPYAGGY